MSFFSFRSFSKALQYSKINGHCTNVQSVKQVLGYSLVINIYQLACVFCHVLNWTNFLLVHNLGDGTLKLNRVTDAEV